MFDQSNYPDFEKLSFSDKTKNILRQQKIESFHKLLSFTPKEFLKFRNCGKTILDEIQSVINHHGFIMGSTKDIPEKKAQTLSPKTPEQKILELKLSPRALNAITNAGIFTLSKLKLLEDNELLEIPNFSKRNLSELRKALNIKKEEQNPKTSIKEAISLEENSGIFKTSDSLDKLPLSNRAIIALKAAGIFKVNQITETEQEELLKIPNLGRIAVHQIEQVLAKIEIKSEKSAEDHDQTAPLRIDQKRPNIVVKSNVWIDKLSPATNFYSASYPGNLSQVQKQIPGDYMIDFIKFENPMEDPTNVHTIRNRLTQKQRAEFIAYRFFLMGGSTGYIAEELKIRKATYYDLERYHSRRKKLVKITINEGFLLRSYGFYPDGKTRTPTNVANGNGSIFYNDEEGNLIKEEKYLDGIIID